MLIRALRGSFKFKRIDMLVTQSDLLKNLLVRGPGEGLLTNELENSSAKTMEFNPLVGNGFAPRPIFQPPWSNITERPVCGCEGSQESQFVTNRLIQALVGMVEKLINRLTNLMGLERTPNNFQLSGEDNNGGISGPTGSINAFPWVSDSQVNVDPGFQVDRGFLIPRDPGFSIPNENKELSKQQNSGGRLGNIFEGLKNGWAALKDIFSFGKEVWPTVRQGWSSLKDFAKPILGGFGSMVSAPLRGIGNLFTQGFNFIKNLV
jgi:hypothetical protein